MVVAAEAVDVVVVAEAVDVVVVAVAVDVAAVAAEAAVAAAGAAAVTEAAAYRGAVAVIVESMQFLAHWQKKEGAVGGSTNYPANCLRHCPFATCLTCLVLLVLSAPRTPLDKCTLLRIIAQ